MNKVVSLAVAASVLALSSAAFAAETPAQNNAGQQAQGKVVQAQAKDCTTIKDEKAKAKCEEENKAQGTKAPAAN